MSNRDDLIQKVQEAIKQMYDTADEIMQHNVKFDLEWTKRAMEQPTTFPQIAAPFRPVSVPVYPVQPLNFVYGEFKITKPGPKRPLPSRPPLWDLD